MFCQRWFFVPKHYADRKRNFKNSTHFRCIMKCVMYKHYGFVGKMAVANIWVEKVQGQQKLNQSMFIMCNNIHDALKVRFSSGKKFSVVIVGWLHAFFKRTGINLLTVSSSAQVTIPTKCKPSLISGTLPLYNLFTLVLFLVIFHFVSEKIEGEKFKL